MTTECKQATFEFHGLFQRKVKARFDGGKITSDERVLLLRVVCGRGRNPTLSVCALNVDRHPANGILRSS